MDSALHGIGGDFSNLSSYTDKLIDLIRYVLVMCSAAALLRPRVFTYVTLDRN